MSERMLLIDGDIFLYNACLGAEYEMRWDDNTHVLAADFDKALEGFENQVRFVMNKLETGLLRIAFTKDEGQNLFRYKLAPSYKANRVSKRKPMCFARVREAVEADLTCLSLPGLEADDILGIWATRDQKHEYVIVSEDKDLQTIPGKLWRKGNLLTISEADADYYHMYQTLVGDVTDGYTGCLGVGPVKAEKILDNCWNLCDFLHADAWRAVVKAYEKSGLTEDDALVQSRLARILRSSDWNSAKKEPILWSPPKL